MTRPALAVLLVSCLLLFGFVAVSGTVAGQDGTAERSLNTTTVAPGEAVEVTVTADLDSPASVDFADSWSPPAANSSVVSVSFDRAGLGIAGAEEVALFSDGQVAAGSIEIVYTLTVPADAEDGTVYEWEPAADGDGSFLSAGDDDRPIDGDQRFDVVTDGGSDDGGDDGGSDDGGDDGGSDDGGDDGAGDSTDGGDDSTDDGTDGNNGGGDDGSGPGFGLVAVVLAVGLVAVYSARRSRSG